MAHKVSNEMLTAYILGELKEETRIKLERAIERNPDLKAEVEAMRSVASLATKAFKEARDPDMTLTDDQRTQVRQTAHSSGNLFSSNGSIFDTPTNSGADFSGNLFNSSSPAQATPVARTTPSANTEPQVGGRNENSVLFSLSNLQNMVQTAPASPQATGAKASQEEASGLIDIRSLAAVVSMPQVEKPSAPPAMGSVGFAPVLAAPKKRRNYWVYGSIAASLLVSVVSIAVVMSVLNRPTDPTVSPTEARLAEKIATLEKFLMAREADTAQIVALQAEIAQLEEKQEAERLSSEVEAKPVEEVAVATKTKKTGGQKSARTGTRKPASKKVAAPTTKKAAKSAKSELDALLGAAPESKPKPATSKAEPVEKLPESLTKSQVKNGLEKVASGVKKCARGKSGPMKIRLVISGSTGRVTQASPAGSFAGSPEGSCGARAVKRARFPKFKKPSLTVTYPFRF